MNRRGHASHAQVDRVLRGPMAEDIIRHLSFWDAMSVFAALSSDIATSRRRTLAVASFGATRRTDFFRLVRHLSFPELHMHGNEFDVFVAHAFARVARAVAPHVTTLDVSAVPMFAVGALRGISFPKVVNIECGNFMAFDVPRFKEVVPVLDRCASAAIHGFVADASADSAVRRIVKRARDVHVTCDALHDLVHLTYDTVEHAAFTPSALVRHGIVANAFARYPNARRVTLEIGKDSFLGDSYDPGWSDVWAAVERGVVTDLSVLLYDDVHGFANFNWGAARPGNLRQFAMDLRVFHSEDDVRSVWSTLPAELTGATVVMGCTDYIDTIVPHISGALMCLPPTLETLTLDARFDESNDDDVRALHACFHHFTRIKTLRVNVGIRNATFLECTFNWAPIVSIGALCEQYTLSLYDSNDARGCTGYVHLHTEVLRIASHESVRSFELRGCRGITMNQWREVAAVLAKRERPMRLFMNGCGLQARAANDVYKFVCTRKINT